jgi:hypothetical protein
MNLKEARQQKAIDTFIEEREAHSLTSRKHLFEWLLRKMVLKKPSTTQETLPKAPSDD